MENKSVGFLYNTPHIYEHEYFWKASNYIQPKQQQEAEHTQSLQENWRFFHI